MSLTIIEGPDGAGKSTLIQQWKDYLENTNLGGGKVVITHHDAYLGRDDITPLYMADLTHAHENRFNHYIMDRCWISEYVYGPVMRGKIRVDVAQRRALERMALSSSPAVVYCMPPFDVCAANYQKRKALEYLPNLDKLVQVYAGYQDIVETDRYNAFPSYGWDYTAGNNATLVSEFIKTIEGAREPTNYGPGIGRLAPGNTLVINDGEPAFRYSFTSYGGQTKWLSLLLDMARIPESNFYYIGVERPDGTTTAGGRWLNSLRPRQVLALTDKAVYWAHAHGLRMVTQRLDPSAVFASDDAAIDMAVKLIKGGF